MTARAVELVLSATAPRFRLNALLVPRNRTPPGGHDALPPIVSRAGCTRPGQCGSAAPERRGQNSARMPLAYRLPSSRRPRSSSPRMVRAAGATIVLFRRSMTSFLLRIRTGRRLTGSRNVYQRISPRFDRDPPSPQRPKLAARRLSKTRRVKLALSYKWTHLIPVAMLSTAADALVPEPAMKPPAEGCRLPLKPFPSSVF